MRWFKFLLLLVLLPKVAAASVVAPLSEPELVAKADIIVFATVTNARAYTRPSGRVATKVELQVYRALRGAQIGDVLEMEIPGGNLSQGITVQVSGAPRLAIGDMVFAFLERSHDVNRPLGLSFGLLGVREVAPGDLRVSRDLSGLQLATRAGVSASPSPFSITNEKLDDFTRRIEQRVKALPTGSQPAGAQP